MRAGLLLLAAYLVLLMVGACGAGNEPVHPAIAVIQAEVVDLAAEPTRPFLPPPSSLSTLGVGTLVPSHGKFIRRRVNRTGLW